MGLWLLKINNHHEKVVNEIEDICNEINKYSEIKVNSFKELG